MWRGSCELVKLLAASVMTLALVAAACQPAPIPTPAPKVAVTLTPAPLVAATPASVPKPVATPAPAPAPGVAPTPVVAPRRGGTLIYVIDDEGPTLDPNQETTYRSQYIYSVMYSGLFRIDPDKLKLGERVLTGDLAESWKWTGDGLTLTITLKPGVTFQDGKPLTAEDVRFTYERIMRPPSGIKSPYRPLFTPILDRVGVPDARTVALYLKVPAPWLLELLGQPTTLIVPKHVVSADPKALEKKGNGSGPFGLAEWKRGISLDFKRFTGYHVPGRPYLDGLKMLTAVDQATRVALLKTRRAHIVGGATGIFAAQLPALQDIPGIQVVHRPSDSPQWLVMNTRRKPFDDVRVRRAVAMLVDQSELSDFVWGYQTPKIDYIGGSWQLPEEVLKGWPPYRGVTQDDVSKAKQLMADAGYGDRVTVKYVQGNVKDYERTRLVLQDRLAHIGIKVDVDVVKYPEEFWPRLEAGGFGMADMSRITPVVDPALALSSFATGDPENYTRISDQQIDALLKQVMKETDYPVRKKLSDQLQKRLWELAPAVPMMSRDRVVVARPEVQGYAHGFVRDSLRRDDIWLAK